MFPLRLNVSYGTCSGGEPRRGYNGPRNKVLGKLGRLTGHGNETTAVVGGTLSIRISTSARALLLCPLSLSLFSPYRHPFLRYLYLHDTCVAYDATRSFSRSSFSSRLSTPSFQLLLFPLLSLTNDHEHRYHDRISPSKLPLVRAGSQSNNHLRALHSYLTRRGSRFYTAPTSPLRLHLCPSPTFSLRLCSSSTWSLSLSSLYSLCIPLDTLVDDNGVSQAM